MQTYLADIPIEIIKKKIKNIHLAVLPPEGRVRISAPETITDEAIILFAKTRIGWIRQQQEKFRQQLRQTERQYISGETLYVWGKQYFLQVDYSYKGNSLVLSGNKAMLAVRKESTTKQREAFINEWYRGMLKEQIEKSLPVWEQRTGLYCSSWQTKYMTTRWGTCNTNTGKIWLNLQLSKKPLECLDYVILHELTHLKIRNHGKDFVAFMDAQMPYWKEIKKQLNDSILDYMDE